MYTSDQYGSDTSFIFHRGDAENRRLLRIWKDGSSEMTPDSKDIHLSTHISSLLDPNMSQSVARASEGDEVNTLNLWHEKTGSRGIFCTAEAHDGTNRS